MKEYQVTVKYDLELVMKITADNKEEAKEIALDEASSKKILEANILDFDTLNIEDLNV